MDTLLISKPVKKHNYYYSRVTRNDKRILKLRIPFAVLASYHRLQNKQGYVADLRVPIDDYAKSMISDFEKVCVEKLILENKTWFSNALDDDEIHTMIKSSISGDDSMRIYASSVRSVGETGADIDDWMIEIKKRLPLKVSVTIVCDGLFIYPTFYSLRWIIGEISEYKEPDDIIPDIDEIMDLWKEKALISVEDLEHIKTTHIDIIKNIDNKIDKIKNISENLDNENISELEKEIIDLKTLKNTFP